MEFYGSPQTRAITEKAARQSNECLKLFSMKSENEREYVKRVMKTLNEEISPFRDDETRDSLYVREMLDLYRTADNF